MHLNNLIFVLEKKKKKGGIQLLEECDAWPPNVIHKYNRVQFCPFFHRNISLEATVYITK